jgi:hypothetical protein
LQWNVSTLTASAESSFVLCVLLPN